MIRTYNNLNLVKDLEKWWDNLDENWQSFFTFNYLVNHKYEGLRQYLQWYFYDKKALQSMIPSIELPSLFHFTLKSTTLLDYRAKYKIEEYNGTLSFSIKSLNPFLELRGLKELKLSNNINGIEQWFLKHFTNLEKITIPKNYYGFIDDILMLNLPKLKEIEIEIDMYTSEKEIEFFERYKNRTLIRLSLVQKDSSIIQFNII